MHNLYKELYSNNIQDNLYQGGLSLIFHSNISNKSNYSLEACIIYNLFIPLSVKPIIFLLKEDLSFTIITFNAIIS